VLRWGTLPIAWNAALPSTSIESLDVIVGDKALHLKTHLMWPYSMKDFDSSKCIFNYVLCPVRRIVGNTFGISAQKFRIYNRRIQVKPENADYIILSTCILHNFIKFIIQICSRVKEPLQTQTELQKTQDFKICQCRVEMQQETPFV
jgi:hypothetical protein